MDGPKIIRHRAGIDAGTDLDVQIKPHTNQTASGKPRPAPLRREQKYRRKPMERFSDVVDRSRVESVFLKAPIDC